MVQTTARNAIKSKIMFCYSIFVGLKIDGAKITWAVTIMLDFVQVVMNRYCHLLLFIIYHIQFLFYCCFFV
jgi:hypothetical protein